MRETRASEPGGDPGDRVLRTPDAVASVTCRRSGSPNTGDRCTRVRPSPPGMTCVHGVRVRCPRDEVVYRWTMYLWYRCSESLQAGAAVASAAVSRCRSLRRRLASARLNGVEHECGGLCRGPFRDVRAVVRTCALSVARPAQQFAFPLASLMCRYTLGAACVRMTPARRPRVSRRLTGKLIWPYCERNVALLHACVCVRDRLRCWHPLCKGKVPVRPDGPL